MNYNPNNQGTCPCQKQKCPCDPIVLPVKVCCINRCYPVEQPIVVPIHTRIINHYIPRPRYYPTYTTSEEDICPGQQRQNNQANF